MTLRTDRRLWLAHCTALAVAGCLARSWPAFAGVEAARILVVGDSLSAEYGLARGTGWVALLAKRLADQRIDARVVNASISGDTTSGGASRLPPLLAQNHPTHVIIELGGNDGLRGLPLAETQANLLGMAKAAKAAKAQVVIVGMQLPANMGREYDAQFAAIFPAVAKEAHAALVPFLLKGIADRADAASLFQDDRIHPKAIAHPTMLNNVWAALQPLLPKPMAG